MIKDTLRLPVTKTLFLITQLSFHQTAAGGTHVSRDRLSSFLPTVVGPTAKCWAQSAG